MDRLVSPEKTPQDVEIAKKLRPSSFSEFIGQQDIVDRLFIAVKGAEARSEPMDHVIFVGEPGLGKTTLARLIGGANLQETSALFLNDSAMSSIMCEMAISSKPNQSLFLDELHSIKRTTAESLYPIMEDGVMISKLSSTGISVPKFTLIGATTKYGKIPPPLRDRFTHVFKLKTYTHLDICKILVLSKVKLNVDICDPAITSIAKKARGVPRIANRFLKIARDYAKVLDEKVVDKAFSDMGIDSHGLDETDREYLQALRLQGKPTGLCTLSSLIGASEEEIEDVVEPWILRRGLAIKTGKGRVITLEGLISLK